MRMSVYRRDCWLANERFRHGVSERLRRVSRPIVRASWKVPAFCCNDWGALKLLEYARLLASSDLLIVYGAPIVLGLVGALRQ